jgi:lysophospholipase L1-like esterase
LLLASTGLVWAQGGSPVAQDDYLTLNENTQCCSISVLANDSDPNNLALTITSVTQPSHGTSAIYVEDTATVSYTPTSGFTGTDTFTYTITNTSGLTATATVHVTVTPVQRLTILPLGDSITWGYNNGNLTSGYGYRIPLLNDIVGDNIPMQYMGSDSTGPINGDAGASLNEGHVGYQIIQITHNLDGNDNSYHNFGGCWLRGGNPATIGRNPIVPQVVLVHIGTNDATSGQESAASILSLLQGCLNSLQNILPNAQIFVASLVPREDNANAEAIQEQYNALIPALVLTYGSNFHFVDMHTNFPSNGITPSIDPLHPNQTGYNWMATQWYTAISAVFHPPVASTASATTSANTAVTIPVLSNDSDPDGYTLSVSSVGTPSNGAAVINSNNTITYTPSTNYTGGDSFSYTISDSRGWTATSTVNVSVTQTYANWAAINGLTGNNALETANPSGDGTVNLMKYALGLNPNAIVTTPTNGTNPGLPSIAIQNGNLTMTYQKNLLETDISYTPQFTTDLAAYDTDGITQNVVSTSGNIETIVASIPMSTDAQKFLRLQVTSP